MKHIIIWSLELLLAVFAGFGTISMLELGYANRFRKVRKQHRVGLLPRIMATLVVLAVSIITAVLAGTIPALAAVTVAAACLLYGAAELVMLPRMVNLLVPALLATASHFIAMAMYAYGGEMNRWPHWYTGCLIATIVLMAVLVLVKVLYDILYRNLEEYREEQAQKAAEKAAKKASRKEKRQIDREVDEEEAEDDQHRFWAIASVVLVVLAIVTMVFLEVKFDFLPPYK